MRQRHRQWLAAMALSLPACSDSYSSSVMPSNTPSIYQLMEQRQSAPMEVPNMFLSSKSPYATIAPSTDRFGGRAIGSEEDSSEEDTRTLGFDTRLHLLDSSKWYPGTAIDPTANHPIKNQVASSLFKKSPLAWLPWIPTLSQIQSLKLSELKQACAERGLIKVCILMVVMLSDEV